MTIVLSLLAVWLTILIGCQLIGAFMGYKFFKMIAEDKKEIQMYDTRTQYVLSSRYIHCLNDDIMHPIMPVPLTNRKFNKIIYKLFGSKRKTTYNRKELI